MCKSRSEEAKLNMSKAFKGVLKPKNKKPIFQFDLDKNFILLTPLE
jgi:hypothetical protein